jgi:hypothetical protein
MTLLPRGPALGVLTRYWKTPRREYQRPECVPSWVTRRSYSGLAGGEILPAHGHQDGRKDWCGTVQVLVLFRLVVPPLQPGVVAPYTV